MAREIARRLIGGIWRTVDVSEGGAGPGGGVSEVVADDASIVVSNGSGPTVGLSAPGGSVPVSSPLDLTGCVLWLDASQLALADDAAVTTWPDLSTSGFDATQATANLKPVCKTAVLNGLRVVRFDDSPNVQHLALSGAGLDLFRNLDACTIAAVARNAVGGGTNHVVFASIGAGGDIWNRRVGLEAHSDNVGVIAGCNDDSGSDADAVSVQWAGSSPRTTVALVGTIDFAHRQLVCEASLPSSQSVAAVFLDAAGALPDTASQAIFVGAVTDASGGSNIDYGEIIVYDRALNAKERRELLEYLSAKWATL